MLANRSTKVTKELRRLGVLLVFGLLLLASLTKNALVIENEGWMNVLGGREFSESFARQSKKLLIAPLTPDKMADEATACAAFVNAYDLSHERRYRQRAKEIADFLIDNSNFAGDGIPGWGPRLSQGYGFCPDRDNFRGKDLWETTRALDCLLKVNEIASSPTYVETAKRIVDTWPSEERRLANQGPYASQGMRFYRKEPYPCARKYVKNTNIAMGEVLYRLANQSHDRHYAELGEQTLNAELWEILTRRNFGYHGAMIYVEPDDPQNRKVLQSEEKRVVREPDGDIVCRNEKPDPSCWNHLAFEAYELYQVELLSRQRLPGEPVWRIMSIYRTSPLGNAERFPWNARVSPTYIAAVNCYLRNSGKAVYGAQCTEALAHEAKGSMIFYSLIPDSLRQ